MLLSEFLPVVLQPWYARNDVWILFYELGYKGGIFAANILY